jgi:hypothetical protein
VYNTGTWLVNAALAPLAAALLSVTGVLETVARWGFGLGVDADNPGVPSGSLCIAGVLLAKYAWSICDLMVQLANRVGDSVINRYPSGTATNCSPSPSLSPNS